MIAGKGRREIREELRVWESYDVIENMASLPFNSKGDDVTSSSDCNLCSQSQTPATKKMLHSQTALAGMEVDIFFF
jgi:hypothetical protein